MPPKHCIELICGLMIDLAVGTLCAWRVLFFSSWFTVWTTEDKVSENMQFYCDLDPRPCQSTCAGRGHLGNLDHFLTISKQYQERFPGQTVSVPISSGPKTADKENVFMSYELHKVRDCVRVVNQ